MGNKNSKYIVLSIEDDEFLADIYATKFKAEGFTVFVANDGEKGLKMARQKQPHVILLDILLPKIDGFAVLKKLKEDPVTKNIPVLLLTNLGQKDDLERGLSLGAADYLIKAHATPGETVTRVKKVLAIG